MDRSIRISRRVQAIDAHIHLRDEVTTSYRAKMVSSIGQHFGIADQVVPVDELADMYRSRNMMAVIMNTSDTTATGMPAVPNDHIAEVVRAYPDVFLGFGVIEPAQGAVAEREALRCRDELGLIGIGELNPARQRFAPNDPALSSLWHVLEDAQLPVLFHGGYAAAGSGTPGGMGVRLRFAQPMLLDDVAAECPGLRVICAHPSWPWTSEALAIAQHKGNVYLDLSGMAPKYFPAELRTYVKRFLSGKVMFGSDWPLLTPDRWLAEFEQLDLDAETTAKVLLHNAMKVLRLEFEPISAVAEETAS
jgi:predicted TIM-barrel fold metal-dependent hydrolase